MQIVIKYNSEKLLPEKIEKSLKKMENNIIDNHNEPDKITIYISHFKGDIIKWIAANKIDSSH